MNQSNKNMEKILTGPSRSLNGMPYDVTHCIASKVLHRTIIEPSPNHSLKFVAVHACTLVDIKMKPTLV